MNQIIDFLQFVYYNITTNDHYAEFTPQDVQPLNVPNLPLIFSNSENTFSQINNNSSPSVILQPPQSPDPKLSWQRIDRWLNKHCTELAEQVNSPATAADLRAFEADFGSKVPSDLRASFLVHNGQKLSTVATGVAETVESSGIIFGYILLSLDAVITEWQAWCNTAVFLEQQLEKYSMRSVLQKAANGQAEQMVRWLTNQKSVPSGAVRCVYAHSQWLPLVTDGVGNNIAVDLAPGPAGRWGQIILCGRDFDTKYVVAPSWAAFLERFADDLENGKHLVLENSMLGVESIQIDQALYDESIKRNNLVFVARNGCSQSYFDVLKHRSQQLHQTDISIESAVDNSTNLSSPSPYVFNPTHQRSVNRYVKLLKNYTLSEIWNREPDRALEEIYRCAVTSADFNGQDEENKSYKALNFYV